MEEKVIIVEPRSKEQIVEGLKRMIVLGDWLNDRMLKNMDKTPIELVSLIVFMEQELADISHTLGFRSYEDLKEFGKTHDLVKALLVD